MKKTTEPRHPLMIDNHFADIDANMFDEGGFARAFSGGQAGVRHRSRREADVLAARAAKGTAAHGSSRFRQRQRHAVAALQRP
jgi:hypothetical protein